MAACRKVGFLGDCLDTDQIDRSEFVDRNDKHFYMERGAGAAAARDADLEELQLREDGTPEEMEDVVKTPPGMRSGS
eukprot:5343952-Pleurochrysis_carterae.AAC.1